MRPMATVHALCAIQVFVRVINMLSVSCERNQEADLKEAVFQWRANHSNLLSQRLSEVTRRFDTDPMIPLAPMTLTTLKHTHTHTHFITHFLSHNEHFTIYS